MMSSSFNTCFPVLIFILVSSPVLALAYKPIPLEDSKISFCFKFRVHVINGFSNNKQPLQLHCWSEKDDLGNHTLYNGGDFNFKFGVKPFGTTHFECNFDWGQKKQHVDVFTANKESVTCCDTGSCYWRAQDDGIYFSIDNQNYQKKFDWPVYFGSNPFYSSPNNN